TLLKVPTEGGPAQAIADAPSGRGGVWGRDGTIFFAPRFSGPIVRVSADGSGPRPVTSLDANAGENSHRYPELTADGDVLLFTVPHVAGLVDAHDIAAVRLSTGERKTLLRGGVHAYHVASGYLVFSRASTLMAMAFDARTLETRGAPVSVLDGIDYRWLGALSDFAVSSNGTVVYLPNSMRSAELVRIRRDGSVRAVPVPQARYLSVSVSPDGRSAVVNADQGDLTELDVVDLERGTRRPFSRGHRDEVPFWSPDGSRILFSSNRFNDAMALFWMPVGSVAEPREIPAPGQWRFITSIKLDGCTVVYGNVSPETGWDIWSNPIDEKTGSRKLLGSGARELSARVSPDGQTLAFVSDESGRYEVYLSDYPSVSKRIQVSSAGGTQPIWAHSGRELFPLSADALMGVSLDPPRLDAATPVLMFRAPFIASYELSLPYDVLPDDRAFIVIRTVGGMEKSHVNVVQNWPARLRCGLEAPPPLHTSRVDIGNQRRG